MAESALTTRAASPAASRSLRNPAALVPVIAAVVALAFAVLPADRAVVAAFSSAVLVVLSAFDLEQGIIPNRIVLPAAAVVLAAQLLFFPEQAPEWLLAALMAALFFFIPSLLGRSWVGMGDVKLALLLGATLGWVVMGAVLIGFLCTFPVALFLLIRDGLAARRATIPLGPFLSFGALVVLFGPHLVGIATS